MSQMVIAPDGTQHIFPDNATPEQMSSAIKSAPAWASDPVAPPQPTPPESGMLGPVKDLGKNLATGLITNAPAAIAGMPAALKGAYAQDQSYYDQQPLFKKFQALEPKVTPPTYGAIRDFLIKKGAPNYVPSTPLGRITQQAATGAGAGIFGGWGAAAAGGAGGAAQQGGAELGLPDWMQAALGILTPIVTGGIAKGASVVRRPLTAAGQSTLAQKVLDEAAVNPNAAIGSPPIAGAPATLGQATGDAGTLALEKQIVNSSPKLQGKFNAVTGGANTAVSTDLQNNFTWPGRGDAVPQMQQASGDMFAALQKAREASSKNVSGLWGKVDPNGTTALDTSQIKQDMAAYVGSLTKARSRFIPPEIQNMIDGLSRTETLGELQDTRSAMLAQARSLNEAGKYNEANVVQGLAQRFGTHVDNLTLADPAMSVAYNAARDASKTHHMIFDDPAVEKALNGLPTGAADTFLRTGTPQGVDSFFKATGGKGAQAAQDWFTGGLAKAAESPVPGAGGNQSLLATPYTRYLNKYRALLNDNRLFTQDQRDAITRGAQQLDYTLQTERAGVRGGSDTYSKLSSDKYLDSMVGMTGAKLIRKFGSVKQTIGTGIGGLIGGTPGAMIGGALMGGNGAGAYSRAAQATLDLVHQAIFDPKFAAELRAFRTNPSQSTLTPGLLKYFAGGGSTVLSPPNPGTIPRP